jgi:hypothetical protein
MLHEVVDPAFLRDVLSAQRDAVGTPDSSPPSKGIVLLGYDGSLVRRVKVTSDGKLLCVLG